MQIDSKKTTIASADARQTKSAPVAIPQYTAPVAYVIGRANALLQGSGRHKNDDTYTPGFTVDQH